MSIDKNRNLTVQKLKLPETLRSHRSYTYDAYGKVKEIKDHRNLLNNSDQAV